MADVTSLRKNIDSGSTVFGGWCTLPSPLTAELVARLGLDFLCIDTQHGPVDYGDLLPILQMANLVGCPALVRVASHDPSEIYHALDAGAQGIVVPMVDDAAEARRLVEACYYPPAGYRSWGPLRPKLGLPTLSAEQANRLVVVVLMIETRESVDNLEQIAAVPGVDVLLVGPSDLAITHGATAGGEEHSALQRQVISAAGKRGVAAGTVCADVDSAQRWAGEGMRFLTIGADLGWMARAARADAERVRRVNG